MDFFLRRMALKMTALALGSIDQDFVTGQYILHSPDMKKNVHMNETVQGQACLSPTWTVCTSIKVKKLCGL